MRATHLWILGHVPLDVVGMLYHAQGLALVGFKQTNALHQSLVEQPWRGMGIVEKGAQQGHATAAESRRGSVPDRADCARHKQTTMHRWSTAFFSSSVVTFRKAITTARRNTTEANSTPAALLSIQGSHERGGAAELDAISTPDVISTPNARGGCDGGDGLCEVMFAHAVVRCG
ncbi:MAG: hypothetical protein ACKVQA_26390 [Burkholderiales bacterium]